MNFRKVLSLSLLALVMSVQGAHSLLTGRHGHTTTLLPDGNYIVIGGVTGSGNASSGTTEIYSMKAAAYAAGAPMPAGVTRSSHTATLMGDGRVLVTGGFGNGVPLGTAEIYDSRTGVWTVGAGFPIPMKSARGGQTATLINKGSNAGNVLICGGQSLSIPFTVQSSCEIFFTTSTSFGTAASMSSERLGHTASAIAGGRVFMAGGSNSAGTYLPNTEIYDPENNQWQPGTALLQGRVDHSATVLNTGNVLISGGYNGSSAAANKIDDPEEAWYRAPSEGAGSNQNPGTHGYLESAEIFDSNGGRLQVSGADYMVMPYRNSRHSAALSSDGRHHMYGGYGNIVPTFINLAPTIEPGSHMDTLHIFTSTGRIQPLTTDIKFVLDSAVARPVDGRVVDGDLYLSLPADPTTPSISVANANIFLNRSTAPLYGSPLGLVAGGGRAPGSIYNLLTVFQPAGLVSFSPQSGAADDTFADGAFRFGGALGAGQTKALVAVSSVTMLLDIPMPKEYITGTVIGSMTLTGGTITDDLGWWTVALKGGTIDFSAPVTYDAMNDIGHIVVNAVFPSIEGMISNTTTTVLNSAAAFADETTGVTLNLAYTSSFINLSKANYSVDKSTIVLREVIFADNLEYVPAKGKWEFGTALYPVFNQSTLVTPGADYTIAGGRNCEASVVPDCQNRTFTAQSANGTYIFRNVAKWPAGKPLNTKRAYHTSTLMPNGRILTCGGSDGVTTLSSCELLNPFTQEWEYTGSMNLPRTLHTATLLPNGRVLAAGGGINSSTHVVTSAEVYYPDTGRWVLTSPMATPRSNHTATLLPDGNVLVAGGDTTNGYSNSAEIYITTGTVWQTVGLTMSSGRAQHTATLMKSGDVMLAGGINGSGALATTDIYQSATRAMGPGPGLNRLRYAHAANLLRDGRVMISGGSDNTGPLNTSEIYNGVNWQYTPGNTMLSKRAHHRSTLLPNGKLMVTGGEAPGTAYGFAEGYDVDYTTWQAQGAMVNRVGHTTVLTSSGILVNIGGWDGAKYLDTTEGLYFSATPDMDGFSPTNLRNPVISTGTTYFDRAERATLLSNTTNFHGFSEASGGGSGSMNSSFHNPRVYIQQIDNPSGFLTDLTTRLYTLYSGPNANWEKTLSSITVILPSTPGEMPYGWYNMRVAANGQFSNGHPVQVTIPRPNGSPIFSIPNGTVLGTSSITWSWNQGSIGAADGYSLYSSSNNVFITTVAFTPAVSYTQAGLQSNTAAGVLVNAYNLGGSGPLAQSATFYTLASSPTALTVAGASFETAALTWNPNGNSANTIYEISMSPDPAPGFTDPLAITVPVPFSVGYTSTGAVINQLSPNQMYYFRVTARNGAGIVTAPSNVVSTITVGNVVNLTGTALSSASISWSWDTSSGANFYELYDISAGTTSPPFIASTTVSYFTQSQGLSANLPYSVGVNAVKNTSGGPVTGPRADSGLIFTLAIPPLPNPTNAFTNTSTGSFTVNWITNGNSGGTVYEVNISPDSLFLSTTGHTTTGNSLNFSGLAANTRYYARVRAFNGDSIPTSYALLGSKYTRARVPTGVTPATISMSGVTLAWQPNENPAGTMYEVRGSTDNFTVSITTYVRFAQLYTGTSLGITGLMTSTSYYFDVAARNGELYETARIQAVPVAFSLPGAGGAPAGSIGGTSDPSKLVSIHGTLPNNRVVTLTVPAGSFPTATGIAISSSMTNACGTYAGNMGRTVEVAVYSEAGAQPQVPVTLTIAYECTKIPGPDISKLVIARYNPVSGTCLPLDTKIDPGACTITSTLNHFSVFQLMLRTAATDLGSVIVYPNPFYTNRGNGFVTIDRLPAAAKVRIYTLSGEKIWEGTAGDTGILIWSGVNKAGELAASGVYLAVIDSSAGKKVLKLAVER